MKLATIEVISSIRPHTNADRLEIVKVLGWQAIVKKGEYQVGDRIIFAVIDTILPFAPWSEFLRDKNRPERAIRLKTVKLRGEYSQGLVLPLNILPENMHTWQEGVDVGAELGIKKFEKELPRSLQGLVKSNFPQHLVSKTDEDNGLSNPALVSEVLNHFVTITQKLDGSSCTVIVKDGQISEVCSRNLSLVESESNAFWVAARKLRIENLRASGTYIIQGECMGPGIQGNQLGLLEPTLYIFQVRYLPEGWFSYDAMQMLAIAIDADVVPLICEPESVTLDALQEIADAQKLPSGAPAEGIVVRPSVYPASGIGRPLGFKIINRNYGE